MQDHDLKSHWNIAATRGPWSYNPHHRAAILHSVLINSLTLSQRRLGNVSNPQNLYEHLVLKIHGQRGLDHHRTLDKDLKTSLSAVIPPSLRKEAFSALNI